MSTSTAEKSYTREEVRETLDEIAKRMAESRTASMHAMLTLTHLLRLSNAAALFDEALTKQAKDLWLKVKAAGVQLSDPPLLFGAPEPLSDGQGEGEGAGA